MNVLFLNTPYLPDFDELKRLDELQTKWAYAKADLAREWQLKRFSEGEKYLSKERFHNGVRDNWKVYLGMSIKELEKVN